GRAAEVLAALGRHPLRARRYAGVRRERAGAVAAGDRAHGVRPVADVVARLAGAGIRRVPPVVVVGEGPVVVVAAIVADEGWVGEVDAGVDRADDDPRARDPFGPDLVRTDLGDAPLRVPGRGQDGGRRLDRLDERIDLRWLERGDARDLRKAGSELGITGDEQPIREPVA